MINKEETLEKKLKSLILSCENTSDKEERAYCKLMLMRWANRRIKSFITSGKAGTFEHKQLSTANCDAYHWTMEIEGNSKLRVDINVHFAPAEVKKAVAAGWEFVVDEFEKDWKGLTSDKLKKYAVKTKDGEMAYLAPHMALEFPAWYLVEPAVWQFMVQRHTRFDWGEGCKYIPYDFGMADKEAPRKAFILSDKWRNCGW